MEQRLNYPKLAPEPFKAMYEVGACEMMGGFCITSSE
jgi:hypothetical protein